MTMVLKSEDKQLKLADDGRILWQADPTNPMPGQAIGRVVKGDALLKPRAEVLDVEELASVDKEALAAKLQEWLDRFVHFTLEPIFRLTGGEDLTDAARGIAERLQEAFGILPRADLEDLIAGLDEEGRKGLRARKVRMGPLLVFLPELNKPAAVRLRAQLLTLWQDKEFPAEIPKDGIVSFTVADQDVDRLYYRSIGYPVYGPRAIRVDMLDRVVCAVYDAASGGKFQAQHKMAEWLGSNILDLYAVLEAMGHTKIHDPAAEKAKDGEKENPVSPALDELEAIAPMPEEKPVAEAEEPVADMSAETETETETAVAGGGPAFAPVPEGEMPAVEEAKPEAVAAAVKPELATFRLKRGKANEEGAPPRERKPREKNFSKGDNKGDKKPFKKDEKKSFKDKKGGKPKRGERDDRDNREDRVYTSRPEKLEDSPFAILQQLNLGNGKK